MTTEHFELIVKQVCQVLERYSQNDPQRIAACKTGEAFEQCVYSATQEALSTMGLNAVIHYTPGSHVFPDIVLEFPSGELYGIEVKSSSSSSTKGWKINGNSVLGSTKEDVIDTFIVFGKTAIGNQAFRYRRYEDAIANVAVTHSPRYAIDMDIAPQDNFFSKSGLTYRQVSESEDPIGLITSYFKTQGQRAWWLAESTPAAIRMFSDLPVGERNALIGYCFAHFPEVFSTSGNKFSRCAMWLASEHSIVSSSLRDNFSAGGRFEYLEYGRIPRIFDTLIECKQAVIEALNDADIKDLCEDWNISFDPAYQSIDRIKLWVITASIRCPSESQVGYDSREVLSHIMGIK